MTASPFKILLALLPALAGPTAFAQPLPAHDEAALRQLVADIQLSINQLDIDRYTRLLA